MDLFTNIEKCKPFLRWAGGKRWLLKYAGDKLGIKVNNYFEPFLGGGSVFFNLNAYEKAFLSDLNPELINSYVCIRDHVTELINRLQKFENTEVEYYKIRSSSYKDDIDKAARFLYLNKASYNGIYRVNSKGEYNVPYGFRANLKSLFDFENIKAVNRKLQGVELRSQDFDDYLPLISKGDLVFLDPPYTVAHENNGFIEYNQNLFILEDQHRLCRFIETIREKGAYYMLTNAKHDAIKEIYASIEEPVVYSRPSTIGGNGARREEFREYVFTNLT